MRKRNTVLRLRKQVAISQFEYSEYRVERIRPNAVYDQLFHNYWHEPLHYKNRRIERNWKQYRKTQYKT
jgi:hypothetical protein